MQLPEISDTTASNVVRLSDGPRKTRVLYAGDMEFAKAQFSSVAPQLQLLSAATLLADGAAPSTADAPDVAVIDCHAPGVDPRAVVDAIRAKGLDLPIVLALDPNGGDQAATRVTTELRVDDYTVKLPGWLARLTSRLEFAIAHHRRRRSLEALQTSAERLRTVVESAPVCLARVATDGTILAMNAAAMKMVSAQGPEDVLGKSLLSFIDAGQVEEVRRFIESVSGGQPGSLEFATGPNGGTNRVVDTRAVPLSVDAEGRTSALLVLRDNTERKRLEASVLATAGAEAESSHALREAEAQARAQLQAQLDAALEECRQLQSERDALRAEAEESRARASMIEHVRAACTLAEQRLRDTEADQQRILSERNALNDDLVSTRERLEATLAQLAEREPQAAQLQSVAAERAHLASRCEALEALVASLEAQQAAEREEHRIASEKAAAELRRLDTADSLAAEREGLLASLAALRTQFDEIVAAQNAAEARHAADLQEQQRATAAVEARLREAEQAHARIAAERDEIQAALQAAQHQHDQLRRSLDDAQETRRGEADAARRSLEERLDDLQSRLGQAAAERDALAGELRAAQARIEQLQHAVASTRTESESVSAEAQALRASLEQRRDELQGRLEAAVAERDAIRDELRTAIHGGNARIEQLEGALRDAMERHEREEAQAGAIRRELSARIEELQGRTEAAAAEREAAGSQLRRALDTATARNEQLQGALDEVRAARDAQAAESEAIRQELAARVQEMQSRVESVTAEREAVRSEMQLALEAAQARNTQLKTSLDELRASRHAQAAEGDAIRRTLARRVEELQTRLDAAMVERETLERGLEEARAELTSRVSDAAAERASLQRRLEQRDAEYRELCVRYDELTAAMQAAPSSGQSSSAVMSPETRPNRSDAGADAAGQADLHDAQLAFREAVQLLSGEIQSAVETTRAQHAALLRSNPGRYDLLEDRLREAEAECRRLAAERDDLQTTERALRAEIQQLIEIRREQRKELVRALQESDETEKRAAARLAECARLRQMLIEAQTALQRLSTWASTQSVRLGQEPATPQLPASRIEAAQRPDRASDDESAAPLETSWN